MTKYYAVHEIHDANGVHLGEVFEPDAKDLAGFIKVGAVREPTEQELAFYRMTSPAAAAADEQAERDRAFAREADRQAADQARQHEAAAQAERDRQAAEQSEAAEQAAREAAAADEALTPAQKKAAAKKASESSSDADLVG